LGIGSTCPRPFILFSILSSFNIYIFLFSDTFWLKWTKGIINFHLRPHMLQPNIYVEIKRNFSKNISLKKYIFCETFKISKKFFFLNIRRLSDELSFHFETLFVEIGWELAKIFDFGYLLGSSCEKILFHNKMKTLYSSLISGSRLFIWAMKCI